MKSGNINLSLSENIKRFIIYMFILVSFAHCGKEADTVVVAPVTGSLPAEDIGTLYPMIQKVYPGTLQSLDIPQSYPTDISPEYPGIVVIFSHVMENTSGEMNTAIELIDATSLTSDAVSTSISPAYSSKYFTVIPLSGSLKENNEYVLHIYKYACAETDLATVSVSRSSNTAKIVTSLKHGLTNNENVTITGFTGSHAGYNADMVAVTVSDSYTFTYSNSGSDEGTAADATGNIAVYNRTLVFDNLVTPPAVTISPADPLYVVYKFRTGTFSAEDTTPPTIAYVNPADGASNVSADPVAGNGYVEIIFYDNRVPMIDPASVNNMSVTLYDITNGSYVTGNLSCYYTDTDYKTFRFTPYPDAYLLASTEYRLRISESSYPVTDFAGNKVEQTDVFFSTAP